MVLLADMGNTNVVLAGYTAGGRAAFVRRLPTDKAWGEERYARAMREALAGEGLADAAFEGAALSSVVPALTGPVGGALRRVSGREPVVLAHTGRTGLRVCIDDAAELGADLLAGAIAAKAGWPMPAIVADLGTATTLTLQDAAGDVQGVAIAPGVRIGLEALVGKTSQLCEVAMEPVRTAVGKNTPDSIKSGVILGAAAMLDGLIGRMEAELGQPVPTVLLTGGLAPLIAPYCARPIQVAPGLLLDGLYRYYLDNRA